MWLCVFSPLEIAVAQPRTFDPNPSKFCILNRTAQPDDICSFFVIPSTNESVVFDFGVKDSWSSASYLLYEDAVTEPGLTGEMVRPTLGY